ncbi:SAF domain-containing protein [Egicoccus sp. AB-alg6-2]|uniref:SAF domain-containing protein n=1 Tax=Egicoccus sp. AB-alg6-2 TaxID=3242692 RepID=UPI00359CBE5D
MHLQNTGGAMADTLEAEHPSTTSGNRVRRRVRRQRGLPGGRAVVGALLVAAAAVGVFAAHLHATAGPDTRYLVAGRDLDAGTRIDADNLDVLFGHLPLELAPAVAERSVTLDQREQLVGRVLTAPLTRGDLLTRTVIADDGGVADGYAMSFPIAAADAVAGQLRRGEPVDVVATYGSGTAAYTAFVVVGVPLVAIDAGDGSGFGGSDRRVLTVALRDQQQVQALAHAVAVADVVVTRAPQRPAGDVPTPYRPGAEGVDPDRADADGRQP